ncbi:MAG: N-acetyltransferase [Pseudomonadota bacterium]
MQIKPLSPKGASGGAEHATLDDFVRVPWALYQDDPHWIPPLRFERKDALSPKAPVFDHLQWQGWVAYDDGGTPVGRITAQIDELYEARYGEPVGFFGMLEAPDDQDYFDGLFEVAKHWLRERQRTRALGPFNLNVNQEVGVLVDGFDSPPYFMMGHHRLYYAGRIEAAGFAGAQDMLAYEIDTDTYVVPPVHERLRKRYLKGLTLRGIDKRKLDEELELMRDIFNDAWSDNWSFVPFTEEEFRTIGKEMLMITPPEFLRIAEIDGRGVAFIVLLPNVNAHIADLDGALLPFGWAKLLWRLKRGPLRSGRVPLMGVRREFHFTRLGPGLSFALIHALKEPAIARGITRTELSWILESNDGMRSIIESIGGKVSKRYRMYSCDL